MEKRQCRSWRGQGNGKSGGKIPVHLSVAGSARHAQMDGNFAPTVLYLRKEKKTMLFHRLVRKAGLLGLTILILLVLAISTVIARPTAYAASAVTINGGTTFQTINGFGFSEAFGQASNIESAPSSTQQQVLDLLFNTSTGAGF